MFIRLTRYSDNGKNTLGLLFIDDEFVCYTLEDAHRDIKIHGETRIPKGIYKITLRKEGGMHSKYLKRYDEMHKGMIWLKDVPDFEYVYIHIGNTEKDTSGCILVGESVSSNVEVKGMIMNSTHAYKVLYPLILNALLSGEDVSISIQDEV